MADIYHIWCNPKEGVDAKDFADKIRTFLGELVKAGKLQSFRVMRMKLGFRSMDLPDFHIMMETRNMQQLDDAKNKNEWYTWLTRKKFSSICSSTCQNVSKYLNNFNGLSKQF